MSTIRSNIALRLLAGCLLLCLLAGCADRPRRNPLDSAASSPLDLADPLEALAGDSSVRLRWDFSDFDDITAVRVWREEGGNTVLFERPASDTSFVDTDVVNGTIYRYWLSLVVDNEADEVSIAGEQLATPGPERGWVADAGSGFVWQLTPDGRRAMFARGRFPRLLGLGVDKQTGAAWVADGRMTALHRIDADGTLNRFGTAIRSGGALTIDSIARVGWVADELGGTVYRFFLDVEGDTLSLAQIDATLRRPVALAASPRGGLWIADAEGERVLWFNEFGTRAGQWDNLVGLTDLDASDVLCCQAWAIAADGAQVLRLTPRAAPRAVAFPYGPARAIDVADASGVAWVLGDGGVVAYDDDGGILMQIEQVPGAAAIYADEANGQLWIAGATELWKVTLSGLTYRTQLTGFTRIEQLTVHPGL